MEKNKLFLTSSVIELADEEDKPYIELTNRLCWYGEPNLNGVALPIEGAEEKAKTLLDMPVQAKYKKIANKDDLGGHEAYRDPFTGEIEFATMSVGTHVAVEVKDDTVDVYGEEKTLPCLFAKSKIWKRHKNVVAAVKRLYEEGSLHTSWEVEYSGSKTENGIKTLTDYWFIGNALLGSTTTPAYPCAETLAVASVEQEDSLIDAAALDVAENKEEPVNNEKEVVVETTEVIKEPVEEVAEVSAEPEAVAAEEGTTVTEGSETTEEAKATESGEQASLTTDDLFCHLYEALRAAYPDEYYCIMYILPEEHVVWCHNWKDASELDYTVFHYAVDNDVVSLVGDPEKGKLVVSLSQVNATISERDAVIAAASAKIQTLEDEIETLKPYKAEADRIAAEKAKAELEEKQNALAEYALSSNLIEESEVKAGGALYASIEALDKASIDSEIAKRYMAGKKPIKKSKTESATIDLSSCEEEANANIVSLYLNK